VHALAFLATGGIGRLQTLQGAAVSLHRATRHTSMSTGVHKCGTEEKAMSMKDAQKQVQERPLWTLNDIGSSISRSFVAHDFAAAMDFLQRVGEVAEARGHHPDLHLTDWRSVQLVLSTHSVGGLTRADFSTAAAIDALPVSYSPKWAREHLDHV